MYADVYTYITINRSIYAQILKLARVYILTTTTQRVLRKERIIHAQCLQTHVPYHLTYIILPLKNRTLNSHRIVRIYPRSPSHISAPIDQKNFQPIRRLHARVALYVCLTTHNNVFIVLPNTYTHERLYLFYYYVASNTRRKVFLSLSLSSFSPRRAYILTALLSTLLQICKRAARAMQISCSRERGLAVLTHSLYAALSRASSGNREHVFYCREWSLARGARVYTSAQCSFRAA